MTLRIEPILTDEDHDEWVRLFANRNELAEQYANLLLSNGPSWPGWADLNQAILRRWSMAGLRYIKTRAWKIVDRQPVKRSPIRRKRPRSIPADVREALNERSQGQCEVRLDGCFGLAKAPHHRKRRSQGGKDVLVNLLDVCAYCHGIIHAFPAWAYRLGLLVESHRDPAEVPVLFMYGTSM